MVGLLTPARPNVRRQQVSQPGALPPPVGGLNAVDAITDMPAQDALVLDNFFCQPDFVEIRKGYESHATGLGAAVDGLFTWHGPTSEKMFGAISTDIFEVTSSGAVGAADVTGLTNGKWQDTMMSTSGGNFLIICNGADAVRNYNGTTWATTPAITGVAPADLINVWSHARRLWFIEDGTTSAWYLGVGAIGGAATEFNFGELLTCGGELIAGASLTRDGGNGPDDFFVVVSSNGEVILYRGTDPATASDWVLVGVYRIPEPIGRRCIVKIGADLGIITKAGFLSLSQMLGLDAAVAERAAITRKVDRFITDDAANFGSNFGWEVVRKPSRNMLLLNVPTSEGTTQRQWAMNTLTGSWSRFTGYNMQTFALLNGELYGGGNSGTVWKLDTGFQDNGGGYIADLKTAFSYFGARGVQKHFKLMRTLYETNGAPGFVMDLNVDFADVAITAAPSAVTASGDVWDTATWDSGTWSGGAAIQRGWLGANNTGETVAVRARVVTDGSSFRVNGFDLVAEVGGIV